MPLRSPHAVALAAALTLAAFPAAASAANPVTATVSYDASGALVVTAADGLDNHTSVQAADDGSGKITILDNGSGMVSADPSCEWGGENFPYMTTCPAPTAIRVQLGDGDDHYSESGDFSVPITIDGGAGKDDIQGEDGAETITGGAGDDLIKSFGGSDVVDGGDGNDELHGGKGPDQVLGGAGNDKLEGDGWNADPMPDVIDGGAGFDSIEDWGTDPIHPDPISVTLGGGADDGRAGEGDDVRDVEGVAVNIPGTYVGSDGDDELTVRQILEPVTMRGGAGNDRLKTADGNDVVDGGPGADYLDGGFGDDHIVGGPGADIIHGDIPGGDCGPVYCKLPYGNDTIDARDGEIDSIDCGFGEDTVVADPKDVVAADCETVDRGSAPGPADPGAGPGGQSQLRVGVGTAKLSKALRRGLALTVDAPAAGTIKAVAKRSGRKVAAGKATAAGAGARTVKLRFSSKARRALRSKRAVKLAVTVTFSPKGGAALKRTVKVTVTR
jgi:Ca2+-binding RTX toxin-like protein